MEKIDRIADALGRVLETAEHHQALADRAIQTMNDTAKKLERKADELKGQINKEIQDFLSSCSSQAVDILTKKFHEADRYAEQAARRYEKAVKWAAWKVCAVLSFAFLSLVFGKDYSAVCQTSTTNINVPRHCFLFTCWTIHNNPSVET